VAEQSSVDFRGTLGRYALFGEIASGGMATVHLARLLGSVGFARTVAIKRLHPHLAKDPDFVGMFLEEARLAARVRHPNVVATLDVVSEEGELFLVLEYVAGESLSRLIRGAREAGERIPPQMVVAIMCAALEGLQAAHDATSERGVPLGIVHRDISPQNIHVGIDGVARVLDFGIAKATNRVQETRSDQIKGKVQYMSPEQLAKGPIDRRADVYSASVVLWEALTGLRLFQADDVPSLVYAIINDEVEPPSKHVPDLPRGLDEIVMRGLDREADNRWPSAREMAVALERVLMPAPAREIGVWVRRAAGDALEWRIDLVHRIESETSSSVIPPEPPADPAAVELDEAASGVVRSSSEGESTGQGPAPRLYRDMDEAALSSSSSFSSSAFNPEVTSGTELRRTSRRTLRIAVAAVALLVVGSLALIIRVVQLQTSAAEAGPSPATPEVESAIGLEIARPPPSSAPPSSPPTAASSVAPPPSSDRDRDRPIARPAAPPVMAPKPPPECDPPYYVDGKGGHHPKPFCKPR
jgi:serine/threonine-protein kinase